MAGILTFRSRSRCPFSRPKNFVGSSFDGSGRNFEAPNNHGHVHLERYLVHCRLELSYVLSWHVRRP